MRVTGLHAQAHLLLISANKSKPWLMVTMETDLRFGAPSWRRRGRHAHGARRTKDQRCRVLECLARCCGGECESPEVLRTPRLVGRGSVRVRRGRRPWSNPCAFSSICEGSIGRALDLTGPEHHCVLCNGWKSVARATIRPVSREFVSGEPSSVPRTDGSTRRVPRGSGAASRGSLYP